MSYKVLISVCLPTLNAREYLEQRVESILSQTVTDWELIVCDSFSNDGTWEYLQQFRDDPRVRLHQVPKEGLYAGWNECLKRAEGEYVYIATADDTMMPTCLEDLMSPLMAYPEVGFAIGGVEQIDEKGRVMESSRKEIQSFIQPYLQTPWVRFSREAMFLMLAGFAWGLGSVTGFLFRRAILQKSGLFPTDLSYLGDAEWTLRAVLASDVVWVRKKLATWRYHPRQASRTTDRLHEAWLFREALRRVVDDPSSGIPPTWRDVGSWRSLLLTPRSDELEMATRLTRSNIPIYWRRFFGWSWETFRLDPKLLWRRLRVGFGSSESWNFSATATVEFWMCKFQAHWPPTPIANAMERQNHTLSESQRYVKSA